MILFSGRDFKSNFPHEKNPKQGTGVLPCEVSPSNDMAHD